MIHVNSYQDTCLYFEKPTAWKTGFLTLLKTHFIPALLLSSEIISLVQVMKRPPILRQM